jgi:hypothetical protein
LRRARETFQRFPLAIVAAVFAAAVAHRLADIEFDEARGADALWPILMACILGISLFYTLRVLGAGRAWPRRAQLAAALAGLLVLGAYYWSLPVPLRGADVVRYFLLLAVVHLCAAFAPFIGRRGEENGFWQYNKALFLRAALAALYAGVIYVGLSLAILACETLLDLDFDNEIYQQLWFWVAIVYTAWFFLAGVPEDPRALQQVTDYPTGLRIFTQYVLIPLVAIYLLILYAYLVKIGVEWNLPKGWVTYPVIGVSVTGMLALLLVHPVRERAESAWIGAYSRLFYWALYPLIGLTFVAIGTRIAEYGITEKRYLVVVASVWLLGIALYFTLRRVRDVRIIPISLCLVSLFSSFGPWGAPAVSRYSQLGRLRDQLRRAEVMTEAGLTPAPKSVSFEQQRAISNIVSYLDLMHGLDGIRSWYAEPAELPDELTPQLALERMGLRYLPVWAERQDYWYVRAEPPGTVRVRDFDYLHQLKRDFTPDSVWYRAQLDSVTLLSLTGTELAIGRPGEAADRLVVDLAPLLRSLWEKQGNGTVPSSADARLDVEDARYRLLVYVTNASVQAVGDSLKLTALTATALVAVKRP